jgi:hypothetical protein
MPTTHPSTGDALSPAPKPPSRERDIVVTTALLEDCAQPGFRTSKRGGAIALGIDFDEFETDFT